MEWSFVFFFNSLLLGVGLAMDAFSVSLANGLKDPAMKLPRVSLIAGVFAFFQALMPLLGWVCVHTVLEKFQSFERWIPIIAFCLLAFLGGKMLVEGIRQGNEEVTAAPRLTLLSLLMQGIATSIDALSVGFTIATYDLPMALVAALLIALVTFLICFFGVLIGKSVGTRLAGKATIFGGAILILIGAEILLTGLLGK